jgi:uncharacterized NAD(P)/FAD-binding protein YdhS
MYKPAPQVAIIGAGASGVLAALHLLAQPSSIRPRALLFEKAHRVGAGTAFSATHSSHLLNVPASSMSALGDDPDHFVRWLDRQGRPDAAGAFVPRSDYGQYLRSTLWSLAGTCGDGALEVVRDEVVDIESDDGHHRLVLDHGRRRAVEAVVLATGVVAPRWPGALAGMARQRRCISDPWRPGALDGIGPHDTVTLVGTGLSAIDALLVLGANGQRGPVHAISRHGLLPTAHVFDSADDPAMARRLAGLTGGTARSVLRAFREVLAASAQGPGSWHLAVDYLRPVTPYLWQRLDEEEQRRFKRHLERLWSIHRHRMAPEVARRVAELKALGVFHVHAGEVLSAAPAGDGLDLVVRRKGDTTTRRWRTDWLVNCTGPAQALFGSDQVLFNQLGARGLARPGPHGIGVATSSGGRLLDTEGRPVDWLWALGSLRQGQLLESNAVPEIRSQACDLATEVTRYLAEDRLPWGRPAMALAN